MNMTPKYRECVREALNAYKIKSISELTGERRQKVVEFINAKMKKSLNEAEGKTSAALDAATDAYHKALFKKQELIKKFKSATSPDQREQLKKQLIANAKEVKIAEQKFHHALASEDVEDLDINEI